MISNTIVVVAKWSYQGPSLGVSWFRSAQSISILLSAWSALMGSREGGGYRTAGE